MGIAFSSIPGVGAISTWPTPGSGAYFRRLRTVARYREFSVPRHRTNSRYIGYSASGSSTGGGGSGTIASPYLVRHMADLRTLLASVIAANTAYYFRNGDTIGASAANSDQGITISVANVSIQGYSDPANPSTAKPVLTGFRTVTGGITVSGNVYDYSIGALRCYWVRGKASASGANSTYRDTPYKRVNSTAAVDATAYTFYDDGAGNVRVNIGDHDINSIQFATATGAGILCQDYDSIGIFGMVSEGWGCENMGAAGGGQCIRFECTGTNEHLQVDCEQYWGPYHTSGKFVSAGSGGIDTCIRPRWGLFGWQNSNGDGDCHVSYAFGGGHECVRLGRVATHAGLPAEGIPDVRGTPVYGHANTGNAPALVIDLDGYDIPTYGTFGGFGLHSEQAAPVGTSARRSIANYTVFMHNHWFTGTQGGTSSDGVISPNAMWGIITNATWTFNCPRPGGSFGQPFSAGGQRIVGLWFNVDLTLNLTGSWSGKRLRVYNATSAHNHDFVGVRFRFTGAQADGIDFNFGTHLQTCAVWNSVFSNETAATDVNITGGTTNHYQEADPTIATGGMSACAFRSVPAAQINGLLGSVTLSAAASWTTASGVAASCINTTLPIPSELAFDDDRFSQGRNANHRYRTIGPIEARPIAPVRGRRLACRTTRITNRS